MIPDSVKENFDMLCAAVRNGDVMLMECVDKESGKNVYALCAINRDEESEKFNLIPFAKMFEGNPYKQILPPTIEDDNAN